MSNNHNLSDPAPWVVKHIERFPTGGSVLDVACGRGRHTRLLLAKGFRVTAVDIDVSGLEDIADNPNLGVIEADLELHGWPFGGLAFDGIVVTNYLHRPQFPDLVECLASGGVLIYETFAVGNEKYGRPSNPEYLLRDGELRDFFARHLDVVAYEQAIDTDPPAVKQRLCAVRA